MIVPMILVSRTESSYFVTFHNFVIRLNGATSSEIARDGAFGISSRPKLIRYADNMLITVMVDGASGALRNRRQQSDSLAAASFAPPGRHDVRQLIYAQLSLFQPSSKCSPINACAELEEIRRRACAGGGDIMLLGCRK